MSGFQSNVFKRLVGIAHEHIAFARRNPAKLTEIAERMGIPEDAALAAAIADHVIEEFNLIPMGAKPCLKV